VWSIFSGKVAIFTFSHVTCFEKLTEKRLRSNWLAAGPVNKGNQTNSILTVRNRLPGKILIFHRNQRGKWRRVY